MAVSVKIVSAVNGKTSFLKPVRAAKLRVICKANLGIELKEEENN